MNAGPLLEGYAPLPGRDVRLTKLPGTGAESIDGSRLHRWGSPAVSPDTMRAEGKRESVQGGWLFRARLRTEGKCR